MSCRLVVFFVGFITISLELISLNSHLRTDVKGRK
nr:MAG TPA: hypothetical protein [Caudoviricetes sp.]